MHVARVAVVVSVAVAGVPARAAPSEQRTMLVPVERVPPLAAPLPGPNILYLNDCKPAGCMLTPGTTDSRLNRTDLIGQPRTLQPYSGSAATWEAMVACVRENYAPFNITVVTTDPGNVEHYEAMVAGLPSDIGFAAGVGGVAPFACGVVPNGISFTFANIDPDDALEQCWTASQESAHVFGLEHSMQADDAMTYIVNPPRKRFVDATACIGTQGCCQPAQECQCGPTTINSYQRLADVLGEKASVVAITTPADGDLVPSGFPIRITAEGSVQNVEVLIDDVLFSRFTGPPYELNADPKLPLGSHTITVRGAYRGGAVATAAIAVTRGDPVHPPGPDAGQEPDPPLRTHETGCRTSTTGGVGMLVVVLAILVRRRRGA
jgi:hypothetical protein